MTAEKEMMNRLKEQAEKIALATRLDGLLRETRAVVAIAGLGVCVGAAALGEDTAEGKLLMEVNKKQAALLDAIEAYNRHIDQLREAHKP